MDLEYNLESEISADSHIISLLKDLDIARQFYAGLCNMQWVKNKDMPEDEQIIDVLKGEDRKTWSCSWRYAGGIIADIRNGYYNTSEGYMDFYCSGNEGYVSEIVKENLERLGWSPKEWDVFI